jgi:hypothetical protein
MRRIVGALFIAAAVVTFSGCGDDDDDAGGGERLGQAEFVEQANAICAAGNEQMDAAFEGFPAEAQSDPDAIKSFFDDELVPVIRQQLDELRELSPPEDVEADFGEMLDKADEALASTADLSGEEIAEATDDPFAEVNAMAGEMGLDDCDTSDES